MGKVSTHYITAKKTDRETKFYKSTAWRKLRKEILKRDGYLCQSCLAKGKISTDCPTLGGSALHVHHLEPIRKNWGRRLDPTNLVTLCNACHSDAHPEKLEKLGWKKKKREKTEKEKRLENVKSWTAHDLVEAINEAQEEKQGEK